MNSPKKQQNRPAIARNRRARFDYAIESTFEAGVVLQGWEMKSIRAGKANLSDTYVTLRNGEAFLVGSRIEPLPSASTHVTPDATRSRKLLLHAREIAQIGQAVQTRGKTCIALALFWRGNFVKCDIGIATGRKQYDKRELIKRRDLEREQARRMS